VATDQDHPPDDDDDDDSAGYFDDYTDGGEPGDGDEGGAPTGPTEIDAGAPDATAADMPTGVADGEASDSEDEKPASRRNERERRAEHFKVATDLPGRRGYSLRQRPNDEVEVDEERTGEAHAEAEALLFHCIMQGQMQQNFPIAETALTQYNMKQGLKRFGARGVAAIEREVRQLLDMDAIEPDDPKTLSRDDRRAAMAYLMFLKEKRDGVLGRASTAQLDDKGGN
jgi:hypothetical protein